MCKPKLNRDCFWLHSCDDMGARLHFCAWSADRDDCKIPIDNCPRDCVMYINNKVAELIVFLWQNQEKEENK